MFENALIESAGRLKTQSKFWTIGTFALNAGVLALMILLPLLHPEALPKTAFAIVLVAPAPLPPPPHAPLPQAAARPATAQQPRMAVLTAPSIIPRAIREDPEPPGVLIHIGPMTASPGTGPSGQNLSNVIGEPGPVVRAAKPATRVVSTGVAAGNLIYRTQPVYPAIARAAHITGTVVLRAIISKTGTIENLSVQSGSPMLRQAALDGVRNWRYKPFLLNGEPTDVDTTITVNFTSGG